MLDTASQKRKRDRPAGKKKPTNGTSQGPSNKTRSKRRGQTGEDVAEASPSSKKSRESSRECEKLDSIMYPGKKRCPRAED